MKSIQISTGGSVHVVDGPIDLAYLQRCVGGYVEAVDFYVGAVEFTMWVNEEGKFTEESNPCASYLAKDAIMPSDWIAGNVVITGTPDEDGDTTGLSEYQASFILDIINI